LSGNEIFRALPSGAPAGNGFLALDGGSGVNTGIDQAISVTAGTVYKLTFDWATGQLNTGNGAYGLNLYYNLGTGSTINTATAAFVTPCANGTACIAQGGTTGWTQMTAYFEATTTGTEYLSFFAAGPASNPPMALLDDVSLVDASEPASLALMLAGLIGFSAIRHRGRKLRGGGKRGEV
jgi:hypothetical protein